MNERHRRLKAATADAHRALETDLASAGFFSGRPGYAAYLERLHPLQADLEGRLEAAGAGRLLADWPRRQKAGRIAADLAALGRPEAAIVPAGAWRLRSAGAVFGVLYVIEGATLGGAILSRRLIDLGVSAGALSYLASYGRERGRMWRGYIAALEAVRLDPESEADLLASALATFSAHRAALLGDAPVPGRVSPAATRA